MNILFLTEISELSFPRFGIMYLSSVLQREGHQCDLLDPGRFSNKDLIRYIEKGNYRILLFSVHTGEHRRYIELSKRLKNGMDVISIFGGPHATFFPEMIREPGVDAVCIGEGEMTMLEVVDRLSLGKPIDDVRNLWVKVNGAISRNSLRPLIEDLDSLPFADRDLFYRRCSLIRNNGVRHFLTGRGCPYRCSYCFNIAYNRLMKGLGPVVRRRSVVNVIEEIHHVRDRYGLFKLAHFRDDTFLAAPSEWLSLFFERYRTEIGIPMACHVRANLVNKEIVSGLKKAGCVSVFIGIECGDQQVMNGLLQRNLKLEQVREAVSLFKDAGITVLAANMVGLPVPDPLCVDMKTLDFNLACRPDILQVALFYPYPKTPLGERAAADGYYRASEEGLLETNKSRTLLAFPPRVKRKIQRLQKIFYLVVEFPFLRGLVPLLVRLPLVYLYSVLFYLHFGLTYRIRFEKRRIYQLGFWRIFTDNVISVLRKRR